MTYLEDWQGPNPDEAAPEAQPPKGPIMGPEDAGPIPGEPAPTRKFTNIPQLAIPGSGYEMVPNEPGPEAGGMPYAKGWETDPRLGMNPQGGWTREKVEGTFGSLMTTKAQEATRYFEKERAAGRLTPEEEGRFFGTVNGKPFLPDAGQAADQKFDRNTFSKHVMDAIGGNPFTIDPYADVQKSDANLPALFNHIFQGKVQWRDLGKLNKEQKAYWEEMKRQYHRQVFDSATSRKKVLTDQFTWMMGNFEAERKQFEADMDQNEKNAIAASIREGKAPPTKVLENSEGVFTLHEYDPKTRTWTDTGQAARPGTPDALPGRVRAAQAMVNRYIPKQPDQLLLWVLSQSKDEKSKQLLEGLIKQQTTPQIPPEDKERYDIAKKILDDYYRNELDRLLNPPKKGQKGASGVTMPATPGQTGTTKITEQPKYRMVPDGKGGYRLEPTKPAQATPMAQGEFGPTF